MMKKTIFLLAIFFLTACQAPVEDSSPQAVLEERDSEELEVVLPIENYIEGRTFKAFGEYIEDRFTGYHVGDDIEAAHLEGETPVVAIADGVVERAETVSGYGGLIVLQHEIDGQTIHSLYGHVDLDSSSFTVGDAINKGDFLANLGEHESTETDGERKHLHFALYEGEEQRINGYESQVSGLENWINPQDFFIAHAWNMQSEARQYDSAKDLGGDIFQLFFEIPAGWELEYIPSIQALNLFTLEGKGTARERSQMLIRYFDASSFLTLNTVTLHSSEDLTVGQGNYTARRYDIEKKPGIANFVGQPSWRNERHIVTDFRFEDGFTRYYVVAANPELDFTVYEGFLEELGL